MKQKYICKPRQRRSVIFKNEEHGSKHLVITDENVWEWRDGFMSPHRYWDWLLDNCSGNYDISSTYALHRLLEQRHRVSVVIFERKSDAVSFILAHGGQLMSDVAGLLREEQDLEEIFSRIAYASRQARQSSFPGLDEFVQQFVPALQQSGVGVGV